jgi:hypothetical protein
VCCIYSTAHVMQAICCFLCLHELAMHCLHDALDLSVVGWLEINSVC